MAALTPRERRGLLTARLCLLVGFSVFLVVNALLIVYIVLIIITRGEPESVRQVFEPVQWLVYSLDVLAGGLVAIGLWEFGEHHDTIGGQIQNTGLAFAVWTVATLTWRLDLLFIPADTVNSVSVNFSGSEQGVFMPHFDFLRINYLGFLVSSVLMFFLMTLLVRQIKNYRVYENFQDISLNRFRFYGILTMVGAIMMGLGWYAFSPSISGGALGGALLVVYVSAWVILFIFVPFVGLWAFSAAFSIHRSAVETLHFILRRKAERWEGEEGKVGAEGDGLTLGTI